MELRSGYQLSKLSNKEFYALCHILNLKPGKETFTSSKFLKFFASCVPPHYSGKKVQPHEIAWHKTKYVPESEKVYFCGWRTYGQDSPYSAKNFEQTKEFLGESVYQFCKENNISSRWTNEPNKRKNYYSPNLYLKEK